MSDQTMPTAAELRHEMREELKRLREINAGLLSACEMALATFRRDREEEVDDREPEIDALRAAIAKARGS